MLIAEAIKPIRKGIVRYPLFYSRDWLKDFRRRTIVAAHQTIAVFALNN